MKFAIVVSVLLLALSGCGGGSNSADAGVNGSGTGGGGTTGGGATTGGGGTTGDGSEQAFGLQTRVAPSGIQIPLDAASGSQSEVRLVDALPNVTVQGATNVTNAGDGSNRLFISDRGGNIFVVNDVAGGGQATQFLDLRSKVDATAGESGLFGIAFDPSFVSNRHFYVTYWTAGTRKWRLSRFTVSASDANVADPNSERVVLEFDHPEGYHFAGWVGFGPDGMLYMSSGDGGNSPQDTSNWFGKILRIRVNADGSYSVPADNPFGNEVWALGFRNPWRCSFDRLLGNLWCGDVGQEDREEIDLIKKGANYGWPFFEGSKRWAPGSQPYSDYEPPVHEYDHTVGVAVIAGYVYRGDAVPALRGSLLFSDFAAGVLWSIPATGNAAASTVLASNLETFQTFGETEAGEVVMAGQRSGRIYRLEPVVTSGSGPTMPATLSATGLFTDLAQLAPAPGMVDYELNSPLWSDGAVKKRWLVLPAGQTIGFDATEAWTWPLGTITVKQFDLPKPGGGVTRLETRVMVLRSDGWSGYTYRWRADGSDAELLAGAASGTYDTVDPASGAAVQLTWNFPSRTQCMNCHTQAAGRVLGPRALQLNRGHTFAATGIADNQLRTWNHIGMFSTNIGTAGQYGAMPDPRDPSAPVEARAKAYLETNCSLCHRPGGPAPVNMDLRYTTALSDMRLVGVANEASVSGVRIVAGDHGSSLLWQRASSTEASVRMPPLGVTMVDRQAMQLLADWIDGLQ
jgi:uncharacterized repeat protein (TIGR03806 family)